MIEKITIDSRYAVADPGTSDGTQIKYFKEGFWYKVDRYGGEGEAEELSSAILRLSNFDKKKYVNYSQLIINGQPGCKSKSFLGRDEQFVTLYRLHMNVTGRDPASVTAMMDYDDAIDYIIDFTNRTTAVDIREYLANIFVLDEIIQNSDRHFNNLGLIYDGTHFRTAPIFDNGKSLGVGLDPSDKAIAKAFSGSFRLNCEYLRDFATFKPDYESIRCYIDQNRCNISKRACYNLLSALS